MIILALKGGLGNQLFQYACARALSLANGEAVSFDVTGYKGSAGSDTPREYLLNKFNIHEEKIASDADVHRFKYPHGELSRIYRGVRFHLGMHNVGYVPRIFWKTGDIYLDGYWQTERYFKKHADLIRRELSLREPLGPAAQTIASELSKPHKAIAYVSLHVRRGDVARDWKINEYYGICTPEYYSKALARMAEELKKRGVSDIRVFVFSDGMDWVKENIDIPYPTTHVPNNILDYEQLILMSLCDHHIIANSSFSWWGAWLDPKPDKIVVAPKKWIKKHQYRHKDICPPEWIRV